MWKLHGKLTGAGRYRPPCPCKKRKSSQSSHGLGYAYSLAGNWKISAILGWGQRKATGISIRAQGTAATIPRSKKCMRITSARRRMGAILTAIMWKYPTGSLGLQQHPGSHFPLTHPFIRRKSWSGRRIITSLRNPAAPCSAWTMH